MNKLREIYEYRYMLKRMVKRDLRSRYNNSFLGFLWTLIVPLAQMLVYYFVFTKIFVNNSIENFPIYLFLGIMPWNFLTNTMTAAVSMVVNNHNLVKKIYFPREILPLTSVCTYLCDFIASSIVLLVVILILRIKLSWYILYSIIIIFVLTLFILGISLILSALYVKMRDLSYIVNLGTMIWFYVTPIVYSLDSVSSSIRNFLYLNPMTGIIISFRNVVLYQKGPDVLGLSIAFVISFILFILGVLIFDKCAKTFAEDL